MNYRTFSFLEEAAEKWCDKTAIVHQDKETSFKELLTASHLLSQLLKLQTELSGRGIAFLCSNGSRFVSGLFGCSLAEAVVNELMAPPMTTPP